MIIAKCVPFVKCFLKNFQKIILSRKMAAVADRGEVNTLAGLTKKSKGGSL